MLQGSGAMLRTDGSTFLSLEVLFGVSAPRALELFQTLDALLHSALTVDFVIPGAYVHSVARLFLLSHHFNKQGDEQRGHQKSISGWTETQTAETEWRGRSGVNTDPGWSCTAPAGHFWSSCSECSRGPGPHRSWSHSGGIPAWPALEPEWSQYKHVF